MAWMSVRLLGIVAAACVALRAACASLPPMPVPLVKG